MRERDRSKKNKNRDKEKLRSNISIYLLGFLIFKRGICQYKFGAIGFLDR